MIKSIGEHRGFFTVSYWGGFHRYSYCNLWSYRIHKIFCVIGNYSFFFNKITKICLLAIGRTLLFFGFGLFFLSPKQIACLHDSRIRINSRRDSFWSIDWFFGVWELYIFRPQFTEVNKDSDGFFCVFLLLVKASLLNETPKKAHYHWGHWNNTKQ